MYAYILYSSVKKTNGISKMSKFTTKELQAALIELRTTNNNDAFEMTFDEVSKRMGNDAFDAWCEAQGW